MIHFSMFFIVFNMEQFQQFLQILERITNTIPSLFYYTNICNFIHKQIKETECIGLKALESLIEDIKNNLNALNDNPFFLTMYDSKLLCSFIDDLKKNHEEVVGRIWFLTNIGLDYSFPYKKSKLNTMTPEELSEHKKQINRRNAKATRYRKKMLTNQIQSPIYSEHKKDLKNFCNPFSIKQSISDSFF